MTSVGFWDTTGLRPELSDRAPHSVALVLWARGKLEASTMSLSSDFESGRLFGVSLWSCTGRSHPLIRVNFGSGAGAEPDREGTVKDALPLVAG